MRTYEVVYIFNPDLGEDGVNEKLEKLHGLITGSSDGEVTAIDHWGARQLAYPIQSKRTGYYVVAQMRAAVEQLPEFERNLKLDGELMRYLVVLNEGEPTSGMSIVAPSFKSADSEVEDNDSDGDDRADDRDRDDDERDDDEGRGIEGPPEFSGGRGRRRRVDGPRIQLLNYKDVNTLSRFMTEQGKILPKRTTKVTAAFQRQLGTAIKRARYLALVPYVRDHEA